MKYRVLEVLFGLVFLVGLYLFAHDTVADQLNNLRQDRTLSDYQEAVSEASPETYEAEMQAALAHNAAITENTFAGDLFAGEGVQADDEYNALLNLNGDGVMGMISIPKINQTIPIYHGTDDSVLQVGAGTCPVRPCRWAAKTPTACWQPTVVCPRRGCSATSTSWKKGT